MRSVTNETAKGFYGAEVVLAYVLGGWNSSSYNVADFLHSFRQTDFFRCISVLPRLLFFFPIEVAHNGISCLSRWRLILC